MHAFHHRGVDLLGGLGRWLDIRLRRPGRGETGAVPVEHAERDRALGCRDSPDGLGIGTSQRQFPVLAEAEVSAVEDLLSLVDRHVNQAARRLGVSPALAAVEALDLEGAEIPLDVEPSGERLDRTGCLV